MPNDKNRLRTVRHYNGKTYHVTVQEATPPAANVPKKDKAPTSLMQIQQYEAVYRTKVCMPFIMSLTVEKYTATPRKMKNLRTRAIKRANKAKAQHLAEVQRKIEEANRANAFQIRTQTGLPVQLPVKIDTIPSISVPIVNAQVTKSTIAVVVATNGNVTPKETINTPSIETPMPTYWLQYLRKNKDALIKMKRGATIPNTRACINLPKYYCKYGKDGTKGKLVDAIGLDESETKYMQDVWNLLKMLSEDMWNRVPHKAISSAVCKCDVCKPFKPVWIDGLNYFDHLLPGHSKIVAETLKETDTQRKLAGAKLRQEEWRKYDEEKYKRAHSHDSDEERIAKDCPYDPYE